MSRTRIENEIRQLRASEAEYTAMIAGLNEQALALPDYARGQYERITDRANALESTVLRIAARRQALEAKLQPVLA